MRIFIPLDFSSLENEEFEPTKVFAMTPKVAKLGAEYGYDDEDCEGIAMDYAAMASCDFETNQKLGRRLVVAAEVAEDLISNLDYDGFGSASFKSRVTWPQIVSLHVDASSQGDLVARAVENESAWDELSAVYLEWFDVSELAFVKSLMTK
ncbi:hypothetical protein BSR29_06550 [Boudabousia liubingyangii]|uniref:Uncharacterized protein n=1 Tax=Boudabousia liubingyangii TaxID=1921764 RepID=A0A1Q5PKW1_9ACTO|nr:hypothetical protein [Boudabousia liubingyangii]OKL47273.1 hypothetical protein BSR29_06550 [Boudabousia liubingyangii]